MPWSGHCGRAGGGSRSLGGHLESAETTPVSEGAAHSLTEQEWEAVCMYAQLLRTRLPEWQ
jgi:hypothetical protein